MHPLATTSATLCFDQSCDELFCGTFFWIFSTNGFKLCTPSWVGEKQQSSYLENTIASLLSSKFLKLELQQKEIQLKNMHGV